MTMTRRNVEILMTGPFMPGISEQIEAGFTAHRLWEQKERDAFLALIGPSISGIAAGSGHVPLNDAMFDKLPNLKVIASFGVGYDHIDAAAAARRGIIVTNTPDVLTEEVADLALGLVLCTLRHLPQADRYLRAGKWLEKPYPLTTTTLRTAKAGIVGLGRIGKAVARRLEAFGVPVAYHGRTRQPDVEYRYYPSLTDMAADVDLLISVAPGGKSTHHIINAEVLAALGPKGVVINVGRGTVIDEQALIKALQDGTIASAGLDVFEDEPRVPAELIAMDHIVLLPHVGSASVHTRLGMGQLVADNLFAWFDGKGPLTPVAETPWLKG
jgi:lactate dehydrogenase-like 2-hydroxyacid dehydrogenase